jgi:hypothetical protein
MTLKLGRLAPHPEETHPRVHIKDHRVKAAAPVALPINWFALITAWGMLLNDQLGDCTAAGILHMFLAMTTYAGDAVAPTNADALSLYERFGYNPAATQPDGSNPTDRGANEQDVLQNVTTDPIVGEEVLLFAQVDQTDHEEVEQALATFGPLYLGILCPQSMQEQFGAGQVIDYVPGSPIEGGHCIILVGVDADYLYVVTWGQCVKMTWAFWEKYCDEAWVVVSKAWLEKNGDTPSGFNLTTLQAAFKALSAAPVEDTKPSGESIIERILAFLRRLV